MKRYKNLHPVTWVLIAGAVIHGAADALSLWREWFGHGASSFSDPPPLLTQTLREIAISLQYFVYPATVEFLVRIWDELRLQRWGILKLNGVDTPPPPNTGEA